MDPYKFLGISLNPDGSLLRTTPFPHSPPTGVQTSAAAPALSKDVILRPSRRTWLRLYLPNPLPSSPEKLPILLYFHGSGFILLSAATAPLHDSAARLAAALPALVLSVEYRLAPEHRLPAAYEDAVDALLWLRAQATAEDPTETDPWLRHRADFARVFLMGNSAGGNIAFHAALRAREIDPSPLKLAGMILDQAFFGGVERTESERRMADDRILPLAANDLMWELALPEGADRDHGYCNPMATDLGMLPRCLVTGHTGDPLSDRQREFAGMMERAGVGVVVRLEEGGHHGLEFFRPDKEAVLVATVRSFVYGGASAAPPPATPLREAGLGEHRL